VEVPQVNKPAKETDAEYKVRMERMIELLRQAMGPHRK
jgi:hypothetical protein